MILIVGSTGFLGNDICRRLIEGGKSVQAFVRRTSDPSKIERLKTMGAEIVYGDLRDRASLDAACAGVDAVISTATTTASRQPGDSIEATDRDGQLSLVEAAKKARVSRFIYVSYSRNIDSNGEPSPLTAAKRNVEDAVCASGMAFTILRPSCFMEVWLSPALGFDFPNGKATLYGSGQSKVSWISLGDVAEFAVQSLDNPAAQNAMLELGGPEALSPLAAVKIFEDVSGKQFELSYVPVTALQAQQAAATDSLQQSFSALMLSIAAGDSIEMRDVLQQFPIQLTSVKGYAVRVTKP